MRKSHQIDYRSFAFCRECRATMADWVQMADGKKWAIQLYKQNDGVYRCQFHNTDPMDPTTESRQDFGEIWKVAVRTRPVAVAGGAASRPRYQRKIDLENEAKVSRFVMPHWNAELRKNRAAYARTDFAVLRDGHLVGWAEIKCRDNLSTAFDTLMISKRKIDRAVRLAPDLPFALCIAWHDAVGWLRITGIDKLDWKVEMTGNRQRNDGMGDVEPCYMIPRHLFTIVPHSLDIKWRTSHDEPRLQTGRKRTPLLVHEA